MPIVAEQYAFVIGVDTHAATHSFALINATNGGIIDQAVFPTSPAGLDRACTWITRGIEEKAALVVIEGAGSFGAGLATRLTNSGLPIAEPAAMPAAQRRGVGNEGDPFGGPVVMRLSVGGSWPTVRQTRLGCGRRGRSAAGWRCNRPASPR